MSKINCWDLPLVQMLCLKALLHLQGYLALGMCGGYCYLASHGGLSRIDLGLGNDALLSVLTDSNYEARNILDHSPFWVELTIQDFPRKSCWKLNPFWLSLFPRPVLDSLTAFFAYNVGTTDLEIVWDASKAHLRKRFIKHINYIKTKTS